MRTETIERTLYTYDELPEDAQETVRQWWNRVQWDDGMAAESMEMIADGIAEKHGLDLEAKSLTFSDLYSQGGHPAFAGRMERVALEIDGERQVCTVTITTEHGGGGRQHMVVSVDHEDHEDEDDLYEWPLNPEVRDRLDERERQARSIVHGIADEMFWAFRKEDEYMGSHEYVQEACEANGYEFSEDGSLA